jgi:hypothetical protein
MITRSKQVGRQIQSMTMYKPHGCEARRFRAMPSEAKEEHRSDIECVSHDVSENIIGALRGQRFTECR